MTLIITHQMLLNTYYMPGTVLEIVYRVLNKRDKVPAFLGLTYSVPRETGTKGIIPH